MSEAIGSYFVGRTPSFACRADPRFSYCLYVPPRYTSAATMLVVVHDTLRNNVGMRDAFVDFAGESNTLVIAPLFPAGIEVPDDLDNYKYLRFSGIRFDEILLHMTAEVAARYGIRDDRFTLFGFSGGGHFVHRFLYVHPQRLEAVVVASPGSVTLPTEKYRWWAGLSDFAELFGHPVSWQELKQVPAHLVVGAEDTNPRGIVQASNNPNWVEGASAAGANRVERLRALHAQLLEKGAAASLEVLTGVGHELRPVVEAAVRFFEELKRARGSGRR